MLLLTNEDVEKVLTMEVCLQAVEDCTREIDLGKVIPVPSRIVNQPLTGDRRGLPDLEGPSSYYFLRMMPVLDLANGVAVLRINAAINNVVKVHERRRRLMGPVGEASHHPSEKLGLLLMFDVHTPRLLAMLQDRHIQTMRVGATGALGAKYMARQDAHTLGLLGAGWMARTQLPAHCLVRDITLVKVFSPNPEHRQAFAERMSQRLGIEMRPVGSPQEALREADIVVSATNSSDPTFDPEWLEPGTRVYCVMPMEYDERMLKKADVIAWGYPGQADHSHAAPASVADPAKMPEEQRHRTWMWGLLEKYADKRVYLTDLVAGRAVARTNDRQVTFCPSPAGGTAGIARFAVLVPRVCELARQKGVGHTLPDEWFHQEAQLY